MCIFPKPDVPRAAPAAVSKPAVKPLDESVLEAAKRQKEKEQKKRGVGSTRRTGPLGLSGQANTTGPTLLGG